MGGGRGACFREADGTVPRAALIEEAATANTGFLVGPECTSLAAKLTVQIVLVMNGRTLTWEVAFTVHGTSPRPR